MIAGAASTINIIHLKKNPKPKCGVCLLTIVFNLEKNVSKLCVSFKRYNLFDWRSVIGAPVDEVISLHAC